ncbi:hypothetical protein [Nocardioides sp. GCM10030258]|uniref:hypothetical protein n=1 Tax=unclassified Nocardioides TaxID=2615069 RepID=UPI00361F6918
MNYIAITEGVEYDPDRHSPTSEPVGDPTNPRDMRVQPQRRSAQDGTPYCGCCPTALSRYRTGRPGGMCKSCEAEREQARKQEYEIRRRDAKRAHASPVEGGSAQRKVVMNGEDADELKQIIDSLTRAVGDAASHFQDDYDADTWQHRLLLASKELVRWRIATLRSAQEPTDTPKGAGSGPAAD